MSFFKRVWRFFKEVRLVSVLRVLRFTKEPIFIVGCGRSGTSLLLAIIGSHPHIFAIPFETRVYHCYSPGKNPKIDRLKRRKRMLGFLFKEYIPKGKKRFCEKTPRTVNHIAQVLYDYRSKAKIIHVIRDGRDVVVSNHPKYKQEHIDPERWIKDVKEGLKYHHYPQVYTVKYEDLVNKTEETLKKIMQFLKEPYVPELLEFRKHTNVKKHEAWEGSIKDIYSSSVERYKDNLSKQSLKKLMEKPEARALLTRLNYLNNEK